MSEGKQPEAAQRLTEAFGESYQKVLQNAVDTQQRNVGLAQGWAEKVAGVMESQAETNRALTRAMESYVNVVEEALESQERTNRALTESLESYRDLVDRTAALQEENMALSRDFFEGVIKELREGTDNNLKLAEDLMKNSEQQLDAFQGMFQEAINSYMELMNAPYELYRKNVEAFTRQNR